MRVPITRTSVCGCVWQYDRLTWQGWKWTCIKRCDEHGGTRGGVSPSGKERGE